MDRWKAEQGRGREKRKIRREKSRRERVRRKKMQMREKVGKSRNTVFFQWFGAPKARKVGSAGAEAAGQMRDEKLHAVVARSTFWSQYVQNTPASDHFWKLKCWKGARCCGAKHILKSKCTKHTIVGPPLEVEMSKKCTPLWREAHFQVKMCKTLHVRATLEVQMSKKCTPLWRENVQNTRGSDHFWRFRCRFASLHFTTLHSTPLHYNYNYNYNYNYTTTPHCTPLHSTTLSHYTTLHYTTLHYLPLHFTTAHYTPLHYKYNYTTTQLHNYIPLHSTTLNYTTLHYTPLHYITLHSTTLQLKLHNYTTTLH